MQRRAGRVVAVDRAGGEEQDAGHAPVAGGLEQAQGAVEVLAEEVLGRVAFPAPVAPGNMGEGQVYENVVALQAGCGAVEVEGREGCGCVEGAATAEGGDGATAGEEVGDGRRVGTRLSR